MHQAFLALSFPFPEAIFSTSRGKTRHCIQYDLHLEWQNSLEAACSHKGGIEQELTYGM